MKLFSDPGHVILLALGLAIVLGIFLVFRRRRNDGHQIDHLDDDSQRPGGHAHQHPPGHGHPPGAGHRPADTERHHP